MEEEAYKIRTTVECCNLVPELASDKIAAQQSLSLAVYPEGGSAGG